MQNLNSEQQQEYNDFIKQSVADGSYFKDARDWYIFRYIYPICERTILFFAILITGFVTYLLTITIHNALPMKEEVPIIIRPKDQSLYLPAIKELQDSARLRNVDEAVSKYLLTKYIKKREEYNFKKITLQDLNDQLKYIKNNSSNQEYINYQSFLSKSNPQSPIIYFGRDFQRIVDIESVSFPKQPKSNIIDKAIDFVVSEIPKEAEIRYIITTKVNSVATSRQRYLARINFKFSGVDANAKAGSELGFKVNQYKIYRIK